MSTTGHFSSSRHYGDSLKTCGLIEIRSAADQEATLILNRLHDQVRQHYAAYDLNNCTSFYPTFSAAISTVILWLHHMLDIMSVEEARSILTFQQAHLWQTSERFYWLFQVICSEEGSDANTTDLCYVPSDGRDSATTLPRLDYRAYSKASITPFP